MTKPDPNVIDILGMELEGNLPHWLSPGQRVDREAIRAKHRAAAMAKVKPASADTMAALQAAYEAAKAADPAFDAEALAEITAFARHRRRPMVPPIADSEGAAEADAWNRHRYAQSRALDEPNVELSDETAPENVPEKLQIVAWAKAIIVLDKSEVMVRDLIERELAGANLMPIARAIRTTDALMRKIRDIRESALKLAFRLLRDRLGDKPILDRSLSTWASAFAKDDLASIRQAIQTGLAEGIDSTEIARKVVGTMALNGVDGITEMTRHKIAHLGVVAVRAARK